VPVVDASVVVALFRADDPGHAASRTWLDRTLDLDEPITAPSILLAEVAAALARGLDDDALAFRAVDTILQGPLVELHPVTAELGQAAAVLATSCRLRGCDAVYAALASTLQVPLVTLDRQQLERAAGAAETRRP